MNDSGHRAATSSTGLRPKGLAIRLSGGSGARSARRSSGAAEFLRLVAVSAWSWSRGVLRIAFAALMVAALAGFQLPAAFSGVPAAKNGVSDATVAASGALARATGIVTGFAPEGGRLALAAPDRGFDPGHPSVTTTFSHASEIGVIGPAGTILSDAYIPVAPETAHTYLAQAPPAFDR